MTHRPGGIRYALVQDAPAVREPERNLATVSRLAERLAGHADLLVLPEMFLTGYLLDPGLERIAETADGPSIRVLRGLANRHRLIIVCGFPERTPQGRYNSAIVIDRDGHPAGVYRKTHLFGDEARHFLPGDALPVFHTSAGPLGVLICYDIEFPEPARVLALQGARTLAVPTANMRPYAEHHAVYARARAMENGLGVLIANQVGDVGTLTMCGESRAVTPAGEVRAVSGAGTAVLTGRLPSTRPADRDPALRYLAHRRTDLYASLAGPSGTAQLS